MGKTQQDQSLEEFDAKMKEISEKGLDLTLADDDPIDLERDKHTDFVKYQREKVKETKKKEKIVKKAAEKEVPEGCYIDKHGATRNIETRRLVKGTKAMNPRGRPKTGTIEDYVKRKCGKNGEDIVDFLKSVMEYNQTKKRHKFAWYTAANKLEASKLLLRIAYEKKTEEPDKVVNILINLPKGIKLKDI